MKEGKVYLSAHFILTRAQLIEILVKSQAAAQDLCNYFPKKGDASSAAVCIKTEKLPPGCNFSLIDKLSVASGANGTH